MAKKIVIPDDCQGDLFEGTTHSITKKNEFTEEQSLFVNYNENNSIILAACAGSGKTYSCVQKLKSLVDRGVDPNKIIFFSFTKAGLNRKEFQ